MLSNFKYKKSHLCQESFLVFEKGKPPPGPTGKEGSEKTPPKPKPPTRKLSTETSDSLTKLSAKIVKATREVKNKLTSTWNKLFNIHKEIGDALTKPPEKPSETTPKIPKSYLEAIKAKATPEEQEELKKLRQKAEKEVPSEELKGHKWLGISDKDNNEKPLAKYHKLGRMYLEADEKGETLTVRKEFDRSEKVKTGLKPATILPPTFRTIEITSDKGEPLGKGIRAKDPKTGEVGYYAMTPDGKPDFKQNLSIKGSYKIKPLTFIEEDSEEFRLTLTEEQKKAAERLKATDEYEHATRKTPKDVRDYVGPQNYPVSSLRSLRRRSNADIRREVTADEAERIARAKIDLTKIEGALTHHGIKLDPNSEITGGRYLVSFDGKGCETLGWNSECDVMQKDWLTKLNDKEFINKNLKDGKITLEHGPLKTTLDAKLVDNKYVFSENSEEIKNLEQWTTKEAAKLSQKTKTVELILAMQNGGKFSNHEFAKGYEFNITHLAVLNNLANNPNQTAKLTEKLGKPIKAAELIKSYLSQGGKTMTLEEAKAFAKANNLSSLVDGNNTLNDLYNQSKNTPTTSVAYNWNVHASERNHPVNGGEKCCARMVSDILGLQTTGTGREAVVSNLVSRLMKGNEVRNGNAGVVFGFENFQKGDVIVWQRYNQEIGKKTFAHVGIIRDTINIDGQKFIAIQHDSATIQVDLIPVQSGARVNNLAAEMQRNRQELAARQNPEDRAKLESIFEYRKSHLGTIRIRSNAGRFGDGSKGGGNIMLAVRTKGLSNENPVDLVDTSAPAQVVTGGPSATATPRERAAETINKPLNNATDKISNTESPTGFPLILNYSGNPELKNREPRYIVCLHGDGENAETFMKQTLADVDKLRRAGVNAILVSLEYDPREGMEKSWNFMEGKVDSFFNYCSQKFGKGTFDLVSFSGGYRAVESFLANPKNFGQIQNVSMLDSTYPGDTIKKTLANYVIAGGNVTAFTATARPNKGAESIDSTLQETRNSNIEVKGKFRHINKPGKHSPVPFMSDAISAREPLKNRFS